MSALEWHTGLLSTVAGCLDKARASLGGLSASSRSKLFAAIDNPTQETWEDAYNIIVASVGSMTICQAVLQVTDFSVYHLPAGDPWPSIPTSHEIIHALKFATSL